MFRKIKKWFKLLFTDKKELIKLLKIEISEKYHLIQNNNFNCLNILEQLKEFWVIENKNEIRLVRWRWLNNKNFWDLLWPYIVEKITWKKVQYSNRYCRRIRYMTIGSILLLSNKNTIVWGSWIINKKWIIKKPKQILSVRWSQTRNRLAQLWIECPKRYWDPWLLISRYYNPKSEKKYELWIIPHYVDYNSIKNKFKDDTDVLIVNLLDPIELVLEEIYSCKRTISSSLHWLITSHSYSIPSYLVKFSQKLWSDNVKFDDYFLSLWLEPYSPIDYSKKLESKKNIIKLIDKKYNEKITIDYDSILKTCPFNK